MEKKMPNPYMSVIATTTFLCLSLGVLYECPVFSIGIYYVAPSLTWRIWVTLPSSALSRSSSASLSTTRPAPSALRTCATSSSSASSRFGVFYVACSYCVENKDNFTLETAISYCAVYTNNFTSKERCKVPASGRKQHEVF